MVAISIKRPAPVKRPVQVLRSTVFYNRDRMRQLVPELAEFYIRLDEFVRNGLRPRPVIRRDGCYSYFTVSHLLYDEFFHAIKEAERLLEKEGVYAFVHIEEKAEGDECDRLIISFPDPACINEVGYDPFELIEVRCEA